MSEDHINHPKHYNINWKGEQAIEKFIRQNTPSIRRDGFDKVLTGQTTLEEVLRVTKED